MGEDDNNKDSEQQQLHHKVWDLGKRRTEVTWPGGHGFFLLWESNVGASAFLSNFPSLIRP
jgi:hypothetical protein